MSWHEDCDDFASRIEASAKDANFNDTEFLLIQDDAEDPAGDKVSANKAVLALISPVFYAQFYGPLASNQPPPIEDGTARGFKQLIKFICNPISFVLPEDDAVKVFEISYFARKYQIGSLVSQCRQLLGKFNVEGKELDILNWALSTDQGINLKETLIQEYQLLVNSCLVQIERNFENIFPNGKVNDNQKRLDEGLMLKILGRKNLRAEEHFILMVALDYYSKVLGLKDLDLDLDDKKRLKMDLENEWNEKLEKLKSVISFSKISPKMFTELFEKIVDIVPSTIISQLAKNISPGWKDKDSFPTYEGKRNFRNSFRWDLVNCNNQDWIHSTKGADITLKTNKDAILYFYSISTLALLNCSQHLCGSDQVKCCEQDTITLQMEGHYKDQICSVRTMDFSLSQKHPFYVEAGKKVKISYKRNCKGPSCVLHLPRLEEFSFSKEGFGMEVLEVNGQPVTSPCYSFINFLEFTPL